MNLLSRMNLKMMTNSNKTLIIITGPTAVGKTTASIEIAKKFNTEIVSADARQFYKELSIGTAAPTVEEQSAVKHHFVKHLSIKDYCNAWIYENEAMNLIEGLFETKDHVVLTGGSGLYIDAIRKGIDLIPDVTPKTRKKVKNLYRMEGLPGIRTTLKKTDPEYYQKVDLANPNRIMRAIEVYMETGQKLSEFHAKKTIKKRNFKIKTIILNRPRQELFDRINQRTVEMIKQGFVEEAWSLFKHRHYNALNTLGYKELFAFFSNKYSLSLAIEKIKTNTRRYAKRQLTWFKKYDDAYWLHPDEKEKITNIVVPAD